MSRILETDRNLDCICVTDKRYVRIPSLALNDCSDEDRTVHCIGRGYESPIR